MKISKRLSALVSAAVLSVGAAVAATAQQRNEAAAIAIGEKEHRRRRLQPAGREAGVWVIAETTELPTRFRRIVVTDDKGRYLVPDLPQADYSVWVRGYGLVDSPKMRAQAGPAARSRRGAGARALRMQRIITRRSIGIRC